MNEDQRPDAPDPQQEIPGHPPRPSFAKNPLAEAIEEASTAMAERPQPGDDDTTTRERDPSRRTE